MSDELFPSGPWVGFYNYRPGDRHRMDLDLAFANGNMSGEGNDDVGRFLIKGRYDPSGGECHWTKSYLGAHQVFYRGFREGKGIWGTWEISLFGHGGFKIWPRTAGEADIQCETAEQTEPVEAVAEPAAAPVACNLLMHVHQKVAPGCFILLLGSLAVAAPTLRIPGADWPQFRGPNCAGVAASSRPPIQISPTNGVIWTVEVPWSPSSPCVSGGRIFLTTLADERLQTRCYAGESGRLLWANTVPANKLELFHNCEGSPAASTPAANGHRVVSYFGSFGLVCYDFKGRELWRHPLPMAQSGGSFGTGTSPVLAGNRVILNRDQEQNSSLFALELATGKTVWETPRPEAHGSFGTPILWRNDGIDQVVTPGSVRLNGYDLKTGLQRWNFQGVAGFACTTPVTGDGLLFFAAWSPGKSDSPRPSWDSFLAKYDKNGDGEISLDEVDAVSRDFLRGMDVNHDGKLTKEDYAQVKANDAKAENVLLALRPGGEGDISQSHLAWKATRGLPYVASPLYYNGRIYLLRDGGMFSSFDAHTGKAYYLQERLEAADQYYASPVAADGRIYLVSVPGRLTVVKAGGDKPEVLHQASFGERIFATPALVGTRLYLRTKTRLYAFGQ